MNDDEFYRLVRECNLRPSKSPRVWQDPHDPADQYNVRDPSGMNDYEKLVYINELRVRRGLEPLKRVDDDNT